MAITEFDERLWVAVLGRITISKDGKMAFRFRNGFEITE
jgi:hypothetical protein